jgi:hypothetical protein
VFTSLPGLCPVFLRSSICCCVEPSPPFPPHTRHPQKMQNVRVGMRRDATMVVYPGYSHRRSPARRARARAGGLSDPPACGPETRGGRRGRRCGGELPCTLHEQTAGTRRLVSDGCGVPHPNRTDDDNLRAKTTTPHPNRTTDTHSLLSHTHTRYVAGIVTQFLSPLVLSSLFISTLFSIPTVIFV